VPSVHAVQQAVAANLIKMADIELSSRHSIYRSTDYPNRSGLEQTPRFAEGATASNRQGWRRSGAPLIRHMPICGGAAGS